MTDIIPLKEKTIKMSTIQADKWLTALRSGEYKQSHYTLCNNNGYCCLGVLQMALTGEVEERGLPTKTWLDAHNIEFITIRFNFKAESPDIGQVLEFDQLKHISASNANDQYELSFPQIADLLEHCIEKT